MDCKDSIRSSLRISDFLVQGYLADLTEHELLTRPVPTANHIAWQLGHLILSERHLVEAAVPGSMPELPPEFGDRYGRGKLVSDNPADYMSKDEYVQLAKHIREATLRTLDTLSPADFDRPVQARVPPFVKTAGDAFVTIGSHWALHAGQWVVLRRKLEREVMF
jgi:hypothetical protein